MIRFLTIGLLLLALRARAEAGTWAAGGAVWSANAPVFENALLTGASGTLSRELGRGLALRLDVRGGIDDEANRSWDTRYLQLETTIDIVYALTTGAGRAWVGVGGGVAWVGEFGQRHQFPRFEALGIPDRERFAWALTPIIEAEIGVGVRLRADWEARLVAGPRLQWVTVADVTTMKPGLGATLGAMHAF